MLLSHQQLRSYGDGLSLRRQTGGAGIKPETPGYKVSVHYTTTAPVEVSWIKIEKKINKNSQYISYEIQCKSYSAKSPYKEYPDFFL